MSNKPPTADPMNTIDKRQVEKNISDIKSIISEQKGKTSIYWQGALDAYKSVLSLIKEVPAEGISDRAEKIYKALVEGNWYAGTKEQCLKKITDILAAGSLDERTIGIERERKAFEAGRMGRSPEGIDEEFAMATGARKFFPVHDSFEDYLTTLNTNQ